VIVEKPIDVTLDRADRMIATCRTHRVKLAVIFQGRFMPAYRLLHAAVEGGRLGRLILGDAAVKWYRPAAYYATAPWRGTWELDGGGALINQSIHMVDVLQWVMGPVDAVSAFAGTLAHEGLPVEDTAVAALKFRNGALGTIEAGTSVYPGFPRRLEIHGERGGVMLEGDRIRAWDVPGMSEDERRRVAELTGPSVESGVADPRLSTHVDHQAQLEDFLFAIEHDREPLVNGEEGRKSLEIVLAVYQSARTRCVVPLPLADGGPGGAHAA
jgi:predicted dehydrogenase